MNIEIQMTLDEAVQEILGMLTGLDLEYEPEQDRYRTLTRQLNRALRSNALERDWGFYSADRNVGKTKEGVRAILLPSNTRPRINGDDAVRLTQDGQVLQWAYFLPRDALSKYETMNGLWCAITRQTLVFSRDFLLSEEGLDIILPTMREPRMFRLPETGEEVSDSVRNQLVDFDYPDVIVARAAWGYAQTDPIMQPRVQTLEANYKDLMYQLIERDTNITDTPYLNDFRLPIHGSLEDVPMSGAHRHPHSDF
jgi:hypothetical protein